MKDNQCFNLSENCHTSCSINTRISTWHVIVVYITVFSSIPEKWYWCWLVRELLLLEQTYLRLYSVRVWLLENTMQNKVMHITVLFLTIKCLTTKFLHYTYTILHTLCTTSTVNCRTNNITLDENDTHMKTLPGKALLQRCLL